MGSQVFERAFSLVVLVPIVLGTSVGAATEVNLALEPADMTVLGESLVSNLGTSFATGDINGDGLQDLVTVACNTHPLAGQRTGTVYIIWGDLDEPQPVLDLAQPSTGVSQILGKPDNDNLSCNVACADLNADGFDDVIWGNPQTGRDFSWSGRVYIILGNASFPSLIDLYSQQDGVITIEGNTGDALLGRGLCTCDVDGDGYQDLVISAPLLEFSELLIVRGRDVFPPVLYSGVLEPGVTRVIDNIPNGGMGGGMACRDINSDGRADLLVGAPGAERALLFYGVPNLPDTILVEAPTVPMKELIGEYTHGGLGNSVAFGDLNDDGNQDAIIAAYFGDPGGCYNCGEIYVLYSANSLSETTSLGSPGVPMTRVYGYGYSTSDGYRVLCADLSGDQIDDLVITNRPLDVAETTSIIYGRRYMPELVQLASENGPITRIRPVSDDDQLGRGVATLDIDLDSVSDLFLGAPYASPPSAPSAGIVYCLFGRDIATSPGPTIARSAISAFPNPFAQRTTISSSSASAGIASVSIFDAAGRRVRKIETFHPGGPLNLHWDGTGENGHHLPSGVYFCRLEIGTSVQTRKLVLVK